MINPVNREIIILQSQKLMHMTRQFLARLFLVTFVETYSFSEVHQSQSLPTSIYSNTFFTEYYANGELC
jgi:hypothetical protein